MNKLELLRQADYTFQRGNRPLARKYLQEILSAHPDDEAAWMLLARVEDSREGRMRCYERVLKLNPRNNEARIGLIRIQSISPTLPLDGVPTEDPWRVDSPKKTVLRGAIAALAVILALGTTTYVVARGNPQSGIARLILPPTPTPLVEDLAEDVAAETRARVSAKSPQYAPLVDTLIGLAMQNAEGGMDGAPERPGAEITPFEGAGLEAREKLEAALPQPGSLASLTLTEQQVTSWLTVELMNNPDLPISGIQVYLRDDRIQVWGLVDGRADSTAFLISGTTSLDLSGKPGLDLEAAQIGRQVVPDLVLNQVEAWINQSLTETISQQAPGLEIMNINVGNGLITISGMR